MQVVPETVQITRILPGKRINLAATQILHTKDLSDSKSIDIQDVGSDVSAICKLYSLLCSAASVALHDMFYTLYYDRHVVFQSVILQSTQP